MSLRDKVVVVTGASSGIGRATVLAFARRGAHVVLAARRQEELEGVAQEARGSGVEALVVPTDVSDRSHARALIQATLDRFGKIDILVANAGTYLRCPVSDLTREDVERVMAVNFYGCLHPILEVLPHMLERGSGHIVAMSSMDGKKGIPPDGAYVASKFAIAGLAEVLRQELRGSGVHVATVFPARIDTPMIADVQVPLITPKFSPEKVADAIVRGVLKNRAEIVVPRSSRSLILVNAISPGLADRLVRLLHLGGTACSSTHDPVDHGARQATS